MYGEDFDGHSYLMREVLGGGSGGRHYADGEDTIHVLEDAHFMSIADHVVYHSVAWPYIPESRTISTRRR